MRKSDAMHLPVLLNLRIRFNNDVIGNGIVRLGDFLGEDALRDGRLVRLLDDKHESEPQPMTALMLPGRQNLPRVRAFVDFLASRMAARG